ncbi:TetR/AcrR family transcriptional regulator [Micropruina sonneratiae]|uniref:TetR/AcrR family transcriptional regulator n=1 Tax=Micropruina sonneratiae TaxID=2986940 RepID=UPI002227AEEA|nr:TetR/AcrR family transcriptional regulator [Micropruina sp. KQZ13P-5]MCW3159582.1 TetR/AcrR family transcriptional regulator [Micropruina sp. KQZ13P-5]
MSAALELFHERGYDATTAAAIAQRAGVTEMTFFRHFPSKDSVLIDDPYDPFIADAIGQQAPGLSPIVAAIRGIADAWVSVPPPVSAEIRERLRIVSRTPSLRGAIAQNSASTEDAITSALIARGVAKTEARVAAGATMGALNAALLEWADGTDPDLATAIDAARRVLQDDPR